MAIPLSGASSFWTSKILKTNKMETKKGGYQPTDKLDTTNPPKESVIANPGFNLRPIEELRKHFHRMGNRADRELGEAKSEKAKDLLRSNRDFFKSVANYLDIADHIKMSEL
jgi:hypothetical protein